MGATHSFADRSDDEQYVIKLYKRCRDASSKHVVSVVHPSAGDFFLLNPDGSHIVKLIPKSVSVSRDVDEWWLNGEDGVWELRPLRHSQRTYILTKQVFSTTDNRYCLYRRVVHYKISPHLLAAKSTATTSSSSTLHAKQE